MSSPKVYYVLYLMYLGLLNLHTIRAMALVSPMVKAMASKWPAVKGHGPQVRGHGPQVRAMALDHRGHKGHGPRGPWVARMHTN